MIFRRHQVLTYESYREVEEDYEEIDAFVRHAIEQGCEDIETYYHCTEDFLSEWEDKVAEMSDVIEEVEALRQEIEAFNNEHRKSIVSPKPVEHTLQSVSIPEQWDKVVSLLRSDSEDTVNQGVQLLSGLGQVDAVSKLLVKDVTGLYNLPIRSQYLAASLLMEIKGRSSTILARTSLARTAQSSVAASVCTFGLGQHTHQVPRTHQRRARKGHICFQPESFGWVCDPMITWDAKEMPAHKVRITSPFGVRCILGHRFCRKT